MYNTSRNTIQKDSIVRPLSDTTAWQRSQPSELAAATVAKPPSGRVICSTQVFRLSFMLKGYPSR